MKKLAICLALIMVVSALASVSAFAWDYIDLTGTNTVPVIDGKLDDCYQKIHDFYQPNADEWPDSADPDHLAKGEAWATWDKDNFYSFFKIYEPDYEPQNGSEERPAASYSSMYVAYLATEPGDDDLPQDPYHVLQFCFNRSLDNTLEWFYTGSVPEEFRDNSGEHNIWPDMPPIKFDCINDGTYTYYESAIPWSEIDRTGQQKFEVGHKMTFNYIITWYNADEGNYPYVQYGQGLINDIYDCGGIITLQPAIEEETAAPETAAPETAAPAAEAAPAAAAPAETAAPAAEAAPAAAPVAAAAPAAPAAAAQTGDVAAIAVLAAVAALGTAVVVSKKH